MNVDLEVCAGARAGASVRSPSAPGSAKVQDSEIGLEGNQAMTFDYFLKTGMVVQGRSQPRVGGVAWQPGAGPTYCPSAVNVAQGGEWLESAARGEQMKSHVRKLVLPASCGQ